MLLRIHPDNPNQKKINTVVDILKSGGVIIYPTDTLYAFACALDHYKSAERIIRIKGEKKKKSSDFSLIFKDLSQISNYTKPFSNDVFKMMKNNLPGAFTFLINANNNVPKIFKSNKKVIGIRIPNHQIPLDIVEALGCPLMTTSIQIEEDEDEYITNPELIYERYGHLVDAIIDGGITTIDPSTVVDCSGSQIEIVRQGKGILL